MKYNEFQRPISVDFVPRGCLCGWCGQPAARHLTAIGGIYHNRNGAFCRACGEKFLEVVLKSALTSTRLQVSDVAELLVVT